MTSLDEPILGMRAVLKDHPAGHPKRAQSLSDLAHQLKDRYLKQSMIADLDEAITLYQEALAVPGGTDRSTLFHCLAFCFWNRYDKKGDISDLEKSISQSREAMKLRPPGDPHRAVTIFNLADELKNRYLKQATLADLNEAITLFQEVLDTPGNADRSMSLHQLAFCFWNRFQKNGDISDLEQSISWSREAMKLRPPGHPHRAVTIFNLADELKDRYLKQARIADLEEAIALHHEALQLRLEGHADRYSSLNDLALCLWRRYDKMETVPDLEESINLRRSALELSPMGHDRRSQALYNLADDLKGRYLKQSMIADLDEAITLHCAALDLCPVGHTGRKVSLEALENMIPLVRKELERYPRGHADRCVPLSILARLLCGKFHDQGIIGDIESAIASRREVLEFCPPGHPDHASSLHELALCLYFRFDKQTAIVDLEEAITHSRSEVQYCPLEHPDRVQYFKTLAMLCRKKAERQRPANQSSSEHSSTSNSSQIQLTQPCPSFEHPDYASSLHELALCLYFRFDKQTAIVDLEEAITHSRSAIQHCPPEHPDRVQYLKTLAMLRRKMVERQRPADKSSSEDSLARDFSQIRQLVNDAIHETLQNLPPRLLHTLRGILCNRDAQVSHFLQSPQYSQLLASSQTCDKDQRKAHIHDAVSMYFRYATLSHRWGEHEPVLRDIEGRAIHDLEPVDGVAKLQRFCLAAGERNYLWAWSDTCCIDKDSSVELQQAIGSMFTWYRRSTLTIVHLSDVPDTVAGALAKSIWFRRGWTLQELLAPHNILFFTQDWLVYSDSSSSNHKEDTTIIAELEEATGITSSYLTGFYPGTDDARSRLQWASARRTTLPEDMAYSLFGIFNIHLPVLYGELVEEALGRLFGEIISRSGDISMLDWVGEPSHFHSCFPASITSYRTAPRPPSASSQSPQPNFQGRLSSRVLRKTRGTLAQCPSPQFNNHRLVLPCIIYRVTAVQSSRAPPGSAGYTHHLQAVGLNPLEITLSEELINGSGDHLPYILVCPWHAKLLGPSADINTVTDEDLVGTLARPFCAFLLTKMTHSEYKRIGTSTTIGACPTDSESFLHFKIRMLTIV